MKSRTLTCITAITLFAALAVPVRLAAQHTRYNPGVNNSGANDINANGVVTGISQDGAIDPITGLLEFDTVVWKDGQIINLGTFGGNWSYANAINNLPPVAGFALNTIPDAMTTAVLATGNGSSGTRATPPFAAKLSSETLAGA